MRHEPCPLIHASPGGNPAHTTTLPANGPTWNDFVNHIQSITCDRRPFGTISTSTPPSTRLPIRNELANPLKKQPNQPETNNERTTPSQPNPIKTLHVPTSQSVITNVRLALTGLCCVLFAPAAFSRDLPEILSAVEKRYNSARTLESRFEQRWLAGGRPRRIESGALKLLKPGKMRWDYAAPAGKLFLADGKTLWYASPATGRVEKAPMKAADDFRTPLAFLLGRLNFKKTFQDFELRENGPEATVAAIPRDGRAPYKRVEFTVSPANEITRLLVTGLDETVMEFHFSAERLNAPLAPGLFKFTPQPGVEVIDVKGFGETEAQR